MFREAPAMLLVVAAALCDAHGRVLVQRIADGRRHAGLWEFPGGKVEPGEGPPDALSRELREELAVEVRPSDLTPAGFAEEVGAERRMLLLLYRCRRWSGEPRPLAAAEIAWVEAEALFRLSMPPPDVPLALALAGTLRVAPRN